MIGVALVALAVAAAGFVLIPRPHGAPASATTSKPPPVLSVLSTAPTGAGVDSGSVISVQFSTDLAPGSPMPTLSPAVAGQWAVLSPTLLQYQATAPLVPGTVETITVPGGSQGVVGSRGQHLGAPFTASFTVAPGSTLRLQQMLAELGYLPLNFTAASPLTSPTQEGDPQVGTFTWRWANQPASLTSLWTPGTYNVITKGAVMNFESQHNLKTDGIAGPAVWGAVLTAVENGQGDALPYGYVYVSQTLPESTTVYQNGAVVYQTVANTGVAGAPTGVRDLPRLRPLHGDHHERHQPRRQQVRRPRDQMGQLLQRRRRPPRVPAGLLRVPPERRVCRDAHRQRRRGLPAHASGHLGDGLVT